MTLLPSDPGSGCAEATTAEPAPILIVTLAAEKSVPTGAVTRTNPSALQQPIDGFLAAMTPVVVKLTVSATPVAPAAFGFAVADKPDTAVAPVNANAVSTGVTSVEVDTTSLPAGTAAPGLDTA